MFYLPANLSQRELLREYCILAVPPDDPTFIMAKGGAQFSLKPTSLRNWIALFIGLWQQLQDLLLVSNDDNPGFWRVRSDPPDPSTTVMICLHIGTLHVVKPVLRHILFLRENVEILYALDVAGTYNSDGSSTLLI